MKAGSILLIAALALVTPASVLAKTPLPSFTGDRVRVAEVTDTFAPVRAEIERIEQASSQKYYVAVVQSSGDGAYATRDYVDALYTAWAEQSRQQGSPLDPDRSVLIVLAMANRQIAVHTGVLLQTQYGLQGQAIDRQLVQPYFIPRAKAGDFQAGLLALLNETEKLIAAKDEAARREQQEAAARAAEIRKNAEGTLATADKLRGELFKELSARSEAGLDVKPQQAIAEKASETLARLSDLLADQPQKVLVEGGRANADLQRALDELHRLVAVQTQVDELLTRAEADATKVEQALEADRKIELSVVDVQQQLDHIWSVLENGRVKQRSSPAAALSLAEEARTALQLAEQSRRQLSQLNAQWQRERGAVRELVGRVGSELAQAAKSGASVDAPRARHQQVEEQLATLNPDLTGYQAALRDLESLQTDLRSQEREIASLAERQVMLTRTLPLSATGLVLAALFVVGAGWWLRRRRLKAKSAEQLAAYKQQLVQLLERLDALKQQHQYLPFTDKDFTEPMTGATLAAYNEVEAMHDQLRQRWLTMMDLRQRLEQLFDTQGRWGAGQYGEILRLLADKTQPMEVEAIYQKCAEHLDRLGQAHERAESAAKQAQEHAERLSQQLQSLAKAGVAREPYEAPMQAPVAAIDQARAALRADPLGALSVLEQVQAALKDLTKRVERAMELRQGADRAEARLDEVARFAADQRAAGLKLAEPEADPDPSLAKGRTEHQAVLTALDAGDCDAADVHLCMALELSERANKAIQRQIEARDFCRQDIPARRLEAERLHKLLSQAEGQHSELLASFAPDTWQAVAQNLPKAQALLRSIAPALDDAEREAGDAAQQYLKAAEHLGVIHGQQQQVAASLSALGVRLGELVALRANCRARQKQLIAQAGQVRQWIGQHNAAVRAEARELLAFGEQTLPSLHEPTPPAPVHWVQIAHSLDQAHQKLMAAQEKAQADVRAHEQLTGQLESVRSLAAQVDQLLRTNTADRPRANQRFQTAKQDLEEVRRAAATPQADWAALAGRLKQVAEDFEHARQWANEDIRLAQQVSAAILEAEKHFQRARTYMSLGVSANLSAAESQLNQARSQLKAQAYEQALTLADSAERAARAAYDEAVRETQQRQERLNRQRQQSVVLAPIPSIFGGGPPAPLDVMPTANAAPPSPPAAPPQPSPSSSSTWSSGSSQSSW